MPQTPPSNTPTWTGRTVHLVNVLGGPMQSTVIGAELKAGGQGAVYRDGRRPDFALKISHTRAPEDRARTLAMLSAPPSAQVARYGDADIIQIAWPQQLVLDQQGQYIGFSMRFLDTSRTTSLGAWTNRRERVHLKLSRDDRLRVNLAANLASVTSYVHRAGHALVDLKPDNVQAYRHGYVCLLDCDGFRIEAGGSTFPASVSTPNWRAPEMQHGRLSSSLVGEEQDRFALAVVIYQLLDNDIHPFSGIDTQQPNRSWDVPARIAQLETFLNPITSIVAPSSSHHAFFADDTLSLFQRAFLEAPDRRPTAADWTAHLRQLVLSRMEPCATDPAHWHYGKGCPWCLGAPQRSSVVSRPGMAAPDPAPAPAALPALPTFAPAPPQPPAPKSLPTVPSLETWLKPKGKTAIALFVLGTTAVGALAYGSRWSTRESRDVAPPDPGHRIERRANAPAVAPADPHAPTLSPPTPRPTSPLSEHERTLDEAARLLEKRERAWDQQNDRFRATSMPSERPPGDHGSGPDPPGREERDRPSSRDGTLGSPPLVPPAPIPPPIITRLERLARRATIVRHALALRRASMSRDRMLPGAMNAFELQMEDAIQAAANAIAHGRERLAIVHMNAAERAIEPLERFLHP